MRLLPALLLVALLSGCSTPSSPAPPVVEVGGTLLARVDNATVEAPALVAVGEQGRWRVESPSGDLTARFEEGRLSLLAVEDGVRYHVRLERECPFSARSGYGETNGTQGGASGILDAGHPRLEFALAPPCSGTLTLHLRGPA